MKRWINVLAQLALGAGQVAAIGSPAMDGETKTYVSTGIAAFQLLVSALAHGYNPDGTSAKVAWTAEPKGR